MTRRLVLALLAILVGSASASAQVDSRTRVLPTRTSAVRLGLERQWWSIVPLAGGGDHVLAFNVVGKWLFAHTERGSLVAFDAESGKFLWAARLGPSSITGLPVSVNSDQVFVTNLESLHALDIKTGVRRWRVELPYIPSTGTSASEDFVLVGLQSGKLVGYLAHEKERSNGPTRSAGTFAFAWQTQAEISTSPVVTPKVIAFASQDHRVYSAITGDLEGPPTLLYRFLTSGEIKADMATWGNRTLIVGSMDHNLYAMDLFTGNSRWDLATGAPITNPPVVSGSDVFVINSEGRVLKVDGNNGSVLWDITTAGRKFLAASPSRVYLESTDYELIILDRESGRIISDARDTFERAGLNLRDFTITASNAVDDRIYLATPDGIVLCLRELNRFEPAFNRDPSLPPFGTIPEGGFPDDTDVAGPPTVPTPAPDGEEGAVPPPPPSTIPGTTSMRRIPDRGPPTR